MNEPRVLVSACLLGCRCRYDGNANLDSRIASEAAARGWIPVCPEILGGLTTPRAPAERKDGEIVTNAGQTVTDAFLRGATEAARLAKLYGAEYALLKERDGMTAQKLKQMGIQVFGETQLDSLLAILEERAI